MTLVESLSRHEQTSIIITHFDDTPINDSMPSSFAPFTELDVPVENLFFLDRLTNSEHALHLLHQHLRGRWPIHEVAAAMQGLRAAPQEGQGHWAELLGYEADEVLTFQSFALVDHRPLFRARLASYYGSASPGWMAHRVQEDFREVVRPGDAGIVFGLMQPEPPVDPGQRLVYGYLLAVHLHPATANSGLPMLEDENIILCGDIAVVGGWLNTDAIFGYDPRQREHEE